MKICMFTNTYLPHIGGVANSVSRFTEDLRDMGHEVIVVAPTFRGHEPGPENGNDVLRLPAIQNFNGSDFSVRIPIPFYIDEKIEAFNPAVIHSHHPYLLGDSAIRFARRRGLPIVFTHHTLYEQYTHYVSENNELMETFAAKLSTAYANLCTHVVAPSTSIADLIKKRGVVTPVTVIPTGVDIGFFGSGNRDEGRKQLGISPEAKVVGHVGRLAPEKSISFLAEGVARALEEMPDAFFLVAGDGSAKEDIKRAFEKRGIEQQLIMAGKMTGRALVDAYAAMDVFVFASRTETQGMVLTEAMAAGVPVIAVEASGVREVVTDRVNGRRLPEDVSADSFARSVTAYFRDSGTARKWREAALETAQQFDRQVCARQLAALYRRISEKPAAAVRKRSDELVPWNNLLNVIRAEWDLMTQKARAVADTVKNDDSKGKND